jgi:hypothetical protein
VKLLFDVHIKKAAVAALKRRLPAVDVIHLADWRGAAFHGADDADILQACFEENRVLVTYDQRTIPALLRLWAAEEKPHAGVIFGDPQSVPANRPGAVAAALAKLVPETGEMTNVVRYLRRESD